MEDWYADDPPVRIPTTDEMDKTTPDERAALIGQCPKCGEWTKFDKRVDDSVCASDGEKLLMQSIHSQRTFNPKRKKINKNDLKVAS